MGHRHRSGLGESGQSGSSNQAIQQLFSEKLLAQTIELEESGVSQQPLARACCKTPILQFGLESQQFRGGGYSMASI